MKEKLLIVIDLIPLPCLPNTIIRPLHNPLLQPPRKLHRFTHLDGRIPQNLQRCMKLGNLILRQQPQQIQPRQLGLPITARAKREKVVEVAEVVNKRGLVLELDRGVCADFKDGAGEEQRGVGSVGGGGQGVGGGEEELCAGQEWEERGELVGVEGALERVDERREVGRLVRRHRLVAQSTEAALILVTRPQFDGNGQATCPAGRVTLQLCKPKIPIPTSLVSRLCHPSQWRIVIPSGPHPLYFADFAV
jgi:hypothetical protein